MNYARENGSQANKRRRGDKAEKAADKDIQTESVALRDRIEHVRDMVDDVRERAEVLMHDKPYVVPLAAGAAGFGLGVLVGSRLTRFLVLTAVGTVLSDVVGGEVKRLAGDFLFEMKHRLGEGEGEGEGDDDADVEPRESSAV